MSCTITRFTVSQNESPTGPADEQLPSAHGYVPLFTASPGILCARNTGLLLPHDGCWGMLCRIHESSETAPKHTFPCKKIGLWPSHRFAVSNSRLCPIDRLLWRPPVKRRLVFVASAPRMRKMNRNAQAPSPKRLSETCLQLSVRSIVVAAWTFLLDAPNKSQKSLTPHLYPRPPSNGHLSHHFHNGTGPSQMMENGAQRSISLDPSQP